MSIGLKYIHPDANGMYYNYEKLYGKRFITEMNATYEKAKTATTLNDKIECHNKLLLFLNSVPRYVKFYYKDVKTFKVTRDRLSSKNPNKGKVVTIYDTAEKKTGRLGVVEKPDKKGNYTVYYKEYELKGNDWTDQLTPKKIKTDAFIELEWKSYNIINIEFAKLYQAIRSEKTIESPDRGGKTKGSLSTKHLYLPHDITGKSLKDYYYKKVEDARKTKERPEATLLKSLISKYKLHNNHKDDKGKEKKFGITMNYGNSVRRFKF